MIRFAMTSCVCFGSSCTLSPRFLKIHAYGNASVPLRYRKICDTACFCCISIIQKNTCLYNKILIKLQFYNPISRLFTCPRCGCSTCITRFTFRVTASASFAASLNPHISSYSRSFSNASLEASAFHASSITFWSTVCSSKCRSA